ncbi:hypothetical protein ASB57_07670 [Bordetella sp. N]|nr:hypothetical protein ASB57_07670 [Bordetella sp. N]
MQKSMIAAEMRPRGLLRPVLTELASSAGAGIVKRVHDDATRLLAKRKNPFYYIKDQPADDALFLRTVGRLSSFDFAARTTVEETGQIMDQAMQAAIPGSGHDVALAAARTKVVVDEQYSVNQTALPATGFF